VGEVYQYQGVERHSIAQGTANFAQQEAMTEQQCQQAMALGRESVEKAIAQGASIYIAGEMGIGNTCSASAIACFLLNEPAEQLTGVG
ncbi:nicotinate-nucleotide--dimethylbenzimidazole phosphoribosyltransferase, partial [Acinetobacter sp. ULE_I080]